MTDRAPTRPWNRPSRRGFLAGCGGCAMALGLGAAVSAVPRSASASVTRGLVKAHPSPWFDKLGDGLVQCTLCPRACVVPDGKRGHCDVRENIGGDYYSMVYGNPCAIHADPIEKKPFFHVLPGTDSFSLATAGCNLDCKFCQNWEISQTTPELSYNYDLPPDRIVQMALDYGCPTIASTYVEPTIFFEYMMDIAQLARQAGILKVMHSNGYIASAPRTRLIELLDAACVDLKGATEEYYADMTGGHMEPVHESLRAYKAAGVHLELVTLIVPEHNDSPEHLRQLADWVVADLGPDVPLHFSRFSPMYKLTNLRRTPTETLEMARETAMAAGVKYAYIGNVPGNDGENTYCPSCKELLIRRLGYQTEVVGMTLATGQCNHCNEKIPGIWTKQG